MARDVAAAGERGCPIAGARIHFGQGFEFGGDLAAVALRGDSVLGRIVAGEDRRLRRARRRRLADRVLEDDGAACKRVDVRQRQSIFNSRRQFSDVMRRLLGAVRAPVLVVSFNNEGYLARADMEAMLAALWDGQGKVSTIENDFKRYVGAQIGIYNPQGEKVGKVSHLTNKEYVYVVSRECLAERLASMRTEPARQMGLFI